MISTSLGRRRYSSSKLPRSAVGCSTRSVTSSSSPGHRASVPPTCRRQPRDLAADRPRDAPHGPRSRGARPSAADTRPPRPPPSSGDPSARGPYVVRPAVSPAYVNGTTVSPNRETNQRIGREKATFVAFQRIVLPNLMPATSPGSAAASTFGAGSPFAAHDRIDVPAAALLRAPRAPPPARRSSARNRPPPGSPHPMRRTRARPADP